VIVVVSAEVDEVSSAVVDEVISSCWWKLAVSTKVELKVDPGELVSVNGVTVGM
jgi:hypothetical protein